MDEKIEETTQEQTDDTQEFIQRNIEAAERMKQFVQRTNEYFLKLREQIKQNLTDKPK